ncbi:MAG TPA: glycoside hydrolase family 15 protein [Thermomicrobiales bacterium]|nr:glycoside hydrolase family 15 protein [Thermomicrobiales bacterium]
MNAASAIHKTATNPYKPIGDYALIGDCRSAALVARDGSIDWLAWPRFDSPSIFGALLDSERGGTFRIRPADPFRSTRRYLPDTAIVETAFVTDTGVCIVRDLMPVADEADKRRTRLPEHELLREIEGVEGEIVLDILCDPRPDYGRKRVTFQQRGALGLACSSDGGVLYLRSDLPEGLDIGDQGAVAQTQITITAGQRAYLSLSFSTEAPAVIPLLGEAARERLERSQTWWRAWAEQCTYDGPYREIVCRSALTLKLLTFAPSGAIVAAPTTSLPEQLGGDKNWDYRFCWLRDAGLTVRALWGLGFAAEAEAFVSWTLHATRLTWPELQVVYDVHGRNGIRERELDHLEGYAGSRPVRTGNDARGQYQLDIYGEVADVALQYAQHGGHFDADAVKLLRGIADTTSTQWRNPDAGIWETRDQPEHHTHSKVLCWVALDRLITLRDHFGLDIAADRLIAERGTLRAEIEARGYNERLGSYTTSFNDDTVDASLLSLPLYGYLDATHLRMRSTFDRIQQELSAGPNGELIYRNLPPGGVPDEGSFGICAFWAVECLALAGDIDAATTRFEHLRAYANDVGLFAEEIDPATGAALGNFPQAFTHIGLINAAIAIHDAHERERSRIGNREPGSGTRRRG